MSTPQDSSSDPQSDALKAVAILRRALARHGIELPELGLHFPSVVAGYPIISFGTAPAEAALRLADALDRAHNPDDESRQRHAS